MIIMFIINIVRAHLDQATGPAGRLDGSTAMDSTV